MNGQNWRPPDKGKLKPTPDEDIEPISSRIEIKQEATIKLEPKDEVNMITVPASERAASGSIIKFIRVEQRGETNDFTDVCELAEAKSEVKKEKIDKEVKRDLADGFGKERSSPNDAKDFRSSRNQSKFKRGSSGSKKTKKSVTKKPIKPNTNIHSDNKKPTASKGKDKKHKCSSCDYTTSHKGNLNNHIRKHTGEKPFPCTHCEKRFKQKSVLQRHMRKHVSEFLFSCSNCLNGFSQSDEKLEHETSCKIRRFECHLCKEYSTFFKSNLEYHMRVHHTGEKPFGCDRCSKKFTEQSELKRHQKSHLNPRPLKFKCSICYRNFSQRIEKDEHEAKCKRRGYECYVCKEYTNNMLRHLKDHMRTHTGVRPFQCKLCQKSFAQKATLTKHINRIHK